MAVYRWALAALAVVAGAAIGADPASDVIAPAEPARIPPVVLGAGTETDPAADVIPATGGHHPPRRPVPPPVCEPYPPIYPPAPGTPPSAMPPSAMPPSAMPPSATPPGAAPTEPLTRAPEAGTLAAATFNPNMFGDQFLGTGRASLARTVFLTIDRAGATSDAEFARYFGVVNTRQYRPDPNHQTDFPAIVLIDRMALRVGSPVFTAENTVAPNPGTRQTNPLFENAQVTAALQTLVPNGSVVYISGTATEVDDPTTLLTTHRINVNYNLSQVGLGLALPPDGGMVGRTKLTDDNNPLPRDRVILGYDYYSNPILAAGLDVHRFGIGLEKTFFDQMASIEVRIPFASTLDNVTGAGGAAVRGVEWGNLFTAVKALFLTSDELNVSAGFAVAFPTGSDAVLMAFNGSEFVRVKNQSILVQPFIAALYTPGERFFAQAWLQGSFDPRGNEVLTDFDGTGLKHAGKLVDQSRVALDMQVGYWVYRRYSGDGLRGVAPFFELHYNTTVTDANQVAAPPRTTIGVVDKRFDEVNATVGLSALFGSNLMIMTGLVVPLRDGDNRFFDYQFGIRANWFYGPTARARELADATGARPEALPGQLYGYGYGGGLTTVGSPTLAPDGSTGGVAGLNSCGMPCTARRSPEFFGDLVVLSAFPIAPTTSLSQVPVIPGYHGVKVTDHDGPRLSDRFYFAYDTATDVNPETNLPGTRGLHMTRQIVGMETVVDDQFSLGLRVPFVQLRGPFDTDAREIGDLTTVLKYAIINDPCSGNACTIGINLTFPTGGRGDSLGGLPEGGALPRAVFAQPWIGAVWNERDLFVQGVSSLLMPTQPVYPVAWFNSIGTGYWVYHNDQDYLVGGIAPVLEFHLTTPINNRGPDEAIVLRDQLNLTAGVFVQFSRLTIGSAVSFPIMGPRHYDIGGIFTASYQF